MDSVDKTSGLIHLGAGECMKITVIAIVAVACAACSGKITTTKREALAPNEVVNGVVYYGYKTEQKKSILDRIRNPKSGEITHTMYERVDSPRYCEPVVAFEVVTVPDYGQIFVINYDAALFEVRKFSVTLDKGMLSSVNSESTPGAKTAVETLQGLATLREDIINGVEKQSDDSDKQTLLNIEGRIPSVTPIKCSAKE